MKKFRLYHFISGIAAIIFIAGVLFPAHLYALHKAYERPFMVQGVVWLGEIPVGKTTARDISLLNSHFSSVVLNSVETSCGCTTARSSLKAVAPFQRGAITVSVTPKRSGKGGETIDLNTSHGWQQISVEYDAIWNSPANVDS